MENEIGSTRPHPAKNSLFEEGGMNECRFCTEASRDIMQLMYERCLIFIFVLSVVKSMAEAQTFVAEATPVLLTINLEAKYHRLLILTGFATLLTPALPQKVENKMAAV